MALFNKKNELEKNIEELAVTQGRIQDLTAHINDLGIIRKGIELELKLGADSALEKRLKKLVAAEEKAQKDLTETQTREAKLQEEIDSGLAKQKQEEINEAGKAVEERVYTSHKQRLFELELDRFHSFLYSKSGLVEPVELKKLVGLRYGEKFNSSEHGALIEAQSKAEAIGRERAQKEFDELLAKINEFLER